MSGYDLAREPVLGEKTDYRLGEMPMPIRPSSLAQPLFGLKRDKNWEELCAKFDENKKKAKDRDEWKRKCDDLQIALKEEEIKHLKELYNARVSKLSPDVLAMMSPDTKSQAKTQELDRPSEMTAS